MKKLLLLSILLFIGCAPNTPILLQENNHPISTKLKALNIGIEGSDVISYNTNITDYQTAFNTLFRRNIEQNICQQSADKWGFIDFNITFDDYRLRKFGLTLLFILPLPTQVITFPLSLTGLDNFFHVHNFEAEIDIYDSNKRLVKKYTINDEMFHSSGMVNWRKNNSNIFFNHKYLADIKMMKSIMYKFSSEISKDANDINIILEKMGKISQ